MIVPGDWVILTNTPKELLQGLPEEDQEAILTVVGSPVIVASTDDAGLIELEFQDTDGDIHWVWVNEDLIEPA